MSEPEVDHVEAAVRQMAELHEAHARDITPLQRLVVRVTAALGRPTSLMAALALLLGWLVFNAWGPLLGLTAFDPYPFPVLELVATVVALLTTLLILATQRREEEFARRRAQLTLQLTALTEHKIAKVIGLLEEQRRENPMLPTRADPEAEEMSKAADPRRVLDRIVETHEPEPGDR